MLPADDIARALMVKALEEEVSWRVEDRVAVADALLRALAESGMLVTGRCNKCAFWRRHTEGSGDYGACRHAAETPFTAKKLSPRRDYGCPNWMGTEQR